ncbi:hypothetical protein RUM43_000956 [Polyplax serrata]|uniref:Uncharacterized protein n=1 Tax=Polyplax serrata TaxID=468196 RepID=A0AAN8SD39_POLSC
MSETGKGLLSRCTGIWLEQKATSQAGTPKVQKSKDNIDCNEDNRITSKQRDKFHCKRRTTVVDDLDDIYYAWEPVSVGVVTSQPNCNECKNNALKLKRKHIGDYWGGRQPGLPMSGFGGSEPRRRSLRLHESYPPE